MWYVGYMLRCLGSPHLNHKFHFLSTTYIDVHFTHQCGVLLQEGLKQRLSDITQSLKWIERLDVTTGLAPVAPEMAVYVSMIDSAVIYICILSSVLT